MDLRNFKIIKCFGYQLNIKDFAGFDKIRFS